MHTWHLKNTLIPPHSNSYLTIWHSLMRNLKIHKSTMLSCIANGEIKKQKRERKEVEGEERRGCRDKLLWRLNKIQIRKCLRRKNERFGAQIKTHKSGTVWLTHSSLSLLLFLLLSFSFYSLFCTGPKYLFWPWDRYNLVFEAIRITTISVLV